MGLSSGMTMRMIDAAIGFFILRPRNRWIGLAACILAAGMIAAPRAQAQNLVLDPNFFQAFQFYQTTGLVQAINVPFGPTPPQQGGTNSAELIGPGGPGSPSTSATVTQSITTTPNSTYMVTFAITLDPNTVDGFTATFGDGTKMLTQSPSNGQGFDLFTFTGNSSARGTTTDLTFTVDSGAVVISELDVEAGPAPVTGGGLLSAGVAILGFAAQRRRRRLAA